MAEKARSSMEIPLFQNEVLWWGAVKEGHLMPLAKNHYYDFYANNNYNQLQPLLLSNKGLYVWSENPFKFEVQRIQLKISGDITCIQYGRAGNSLMEARNYVSDNFFPPSGKMPDEILFAAPQYNTWIELTYFHTQEAVINYAKGIIANGLPPGVLMIDESWQEDYGIWKFHSGRFPDPKGMTTALHTMGFKVMLWVVPFVCPDRYLIVNELLNKKALLLDSEGGKFFYEEAKHPALIHWWNGYSACLDFSSENAVEWFNDQLQLLMTEYGIDGFKFDGGDMNFYPDYALSQKGVSPNEQCRLYAEIGLNYSLNEYRACWKMAGKPLAQRLHDKLHTWDDLQLLIPHMIVEGLAGYTFSCPDMIGGGDWTSFLPGSEIDQELVVRSAQCHALMPMMQFSVAPWRVLDEKHLKAIKDAIAIRASFGNTIVDLAKKSAINGDPIVAPMEYYFPNHGFHEVQDQFMLGNGILVAPMVEKGTKRQVILPKGNWVSDEDENFEGAQTYELVVPLNRLPVFMQKR